MPSGISHSIALSELEIDELVAADSQDGDAVILMYSKFVSSV